MKRVVIAVHTLERLVLGVKGVDVEKVAQAT